jgi:hypothetical protein
VKTQRFNKKRGKKTANIPSKDDPDCALLYQKFPASKNPPGRLKSLVFWLFCTDENPEGACPGKNIGGGRQK